MPSFTSRRIDDPQSVKVVRALEAVGAGRSTVQLPAMSASFRDDLRAQLVAVAPRLIAEGVHPGTETAPRQTASTSRRTSRADRPAPAARSSIRTRPMTVLVAGAAVVVLGLGGATWLARNSLPGDALYGLKRTAEGVDVSLSGSDFDKGKTLLLGATRRVQEVSALVTKPQSMAFGPGTSAAGGLSDSTVKLVVSTLDAADTDTQKGVKIIGEDYVKTGSTAGLTLVDGWGGGENGKGGQIGLIGSLLTAIPVDGEAHERAEQSLTNIQQAWKRSVALLAQAKAGTTCTTRPSPDEFGPQPCDAASAPSTPSQPATTAPTSGTTMNPGGGAPTASTGPTGAPATTPAAPGSAAPTASASPAATVTTSGAPPISIDSCGVQVSLPVAEVSLGTCPPNH